MQRDPPQISLVDELLEPSPPRSPEVSPKAAVGSLEESLDMTLAILHKSYIQSTNLQRVLGPEGFPSGFMTLPVLGKAKLVERLLSSLSPVLASAPAPPTQRYNFRSPQGKQELAVAVASQRPEFDTPLLTRILEMPDDNLVLRPHETKQLAGLMLGAIRDSSSEVYKKQVTDAQERIALLAEDLLRCKERLRAKEELILALELKLAGKPKLPGSRDDPTKSASRA